MIINFVLVEKEIKKLLEGQAVRAVSLVGSAAVSNNLSSCRDIDIFVILSDGEALEREVVERYSVNWDITYLPMELLKQGIKEKWPFLIHSLCKHKPIIEDIEVQSLLAQIYTYYLQGPGVLTDEEIKYIRFKLAQEYEDLLKRKKDYLNAQFLSQNLFREILISYFRLNNYWVPRDKKMLTEIKVKNQNLYDLCKHFLEEKNMEKTLIYLEDMIKYVLNPFGGSLTYWPKGKFPLK